MQDSKIQMRLHKGFVPIVQWQLIPTSIQTSEPVTVHCNPIFHFHFVYNMAEAPLYMYKNSALQQWITFYHQNLIPGDFLKNIIVFCVKEELDRHPVSREREPLQSF